MKTRATAVNIDHHTTDFDRDHREIDTDNDHREIEVDTLIQQWAGDNTEKIVKAYAQKGGWEGWAQVEIATMLADRFRRVLQSGSLMDRAVNRERSYVVNREVNIYEGPNGEKSQLRADIVVQIKDAAGKLVQTVIIELKCEGYYNDTPFWTLVAADVKKVGGIVKNEYKPALLWVMGFSAAQDTYKQMAKKYPGGLLFEVYPSTTGPGIDFHPDDAALNPKIALWTFEEERPIGAAGSSSTSQSQPANPAIQLQPDLQSGQL